MFWIIVAVIIFVILSLYLLGNDETDTSTSTANTVKTVPYTNKPLDEKVNINRASVAVLETIPQLNRETARNIVELRKKGIYITKPEDLRKLGLTESKVDDIEINIIITPEYKNKDFNYSKAEINGILFKINNTKKKKKTIITKDKKPKPRREKYVYHHNKTPQKVERLESKVEINAATSSQLHSIPLLTNVQVRKIINYRRKHGQISDIHELNRIINLTPEQYKSVNYNVNFKAEERTTHDLKEKVTPEEKIEINTASLEELVSITGINVIQAKKILQLRDADCYIESYDDLKEKLNLKDYQIMEIEDKTTITRVRRKQHHGRRLDI